MVVILDDISGHSDSTPDELDDLEFLKRGLLLGEGFQLYIVTVPSVDAREAIASALRNTDGLSMELVRADSLNTTIESAVAEAFSNARRRGGRPVVVMTDVEQDAAGPAQLFRRLNQSRNELIADVPGALVVLGSHHAVQTFRKVAPDTWSVRAADVEIGVTRPTAAIDRVEDWPRLQPIAPPKDSDECTRLEHALTTLEHGDERGRIALRLAEVLEFHDRDRRVEALYRQAAAEIVDPWLSAVARVNAGRQLTESGDLSAALDQLKEALRSEAMRDPSLRAYTNLSIAIALWRSGNPESATGHLRTVFDLDSDKDLVVDARLLAAEITADAGDLRGALHHLDAAERVARQFGDQDLSARVQASITSIAARAGEGARVEAAVRTLLSQRSLVLPVQVAWRLWRSGEVRAAETVWTALRSTVAEQNSEPALFEEAARQIYFSIVERPQAPQIDEWLVWLKDGPVASSPDLENWIAVLEGRSLLNAGHAARAVEVFSRALLRGRESGTSSVARAPSVRVAWLGALVLAGRDAEAQASLREVLDGPDREPFLRYLGKRANDARTIDKLPAAEGAALLMTFQLLASLPPSPVVDLTVSPRPVAEWHRL